MHLIVVTEHLSKTLSNTVVFFTSPSALLFFDCEAIVSAFSLTMERKQDMSIFIFIVTKETALLGVSEKQL